jgi:hypothetical protein
MKTKSNNLVMAYYNEIVDYDGEPKPRKDYILQMIEKGFTQREVDHIMFYADKTSGKL